MGGDQTIMETLNHAHGQNDKAVFMRFECAEKRVCCIPDQVRIFLGVATDFIDFHFAIAHLVYPPFIAFSAAITLSIGMPLQFCKSVSFE